MEYKLFERPGMPGTWSVEGVPGIDDDADAIALTVFYGPDSEMRAREYLDYKLGEQGR